VRTFEKKNESNDDTLDNDHDRVSCEGILATQLLNYRNEGKMIIALQKEDT